MLQTNKFYLLYTYSVMVFYVFKTFKSEWIDKNDT